MLIFELYKVLSKAKERESDAVGVIQRLSACFAMNTNRESKSSSGIRTTFVFRRTNCATEKNVVM